ncbi:hypothetical protein [Streptomyces sp. I05A-00742]|nr:hypothetical protein [Streptomyces sp. I05A-00742]
MPDPQARQNALRGIEKAVANGQPVPLGVQGRDEQGNREGHAVLS